MRLKNMASSEGKEIVNDRRFVKFGMLMGKKPGTRLSLCCGKDGSETLSS
jgi:hypothetical protein